MENANSFLEQNWQLLLIGSGLLILLGALFNWKWAFTHEGHDSAGFLAWIYALFGERGTLITTGIMGIVLMICGITLWILV